MGDTNFVVCRDCKYTTWLEDYELIEFMKGHSLHSTVIFTKRFWDDLGDFEQTFRAFMGWIEEAEEET